MIEYSPEGLETIAVYGSGGLLALAYFVKWLRYMFYTDKKNAAADIKDTAVNDAETSLFDNLRKEIERMSLQIAGMSIQINALSVENTKLTRRIAELTASVQSLSKLETENIELLGKITVKDDHILKLTQDMSDRFNKFNRREVPSKIL